MSAEEDYNMAKEFIIKAQSTRGVFDYKTELRKQGFSKPSIPSIDLLKVTPLPGSIDSNKIVQIRETSRDRCKTFMLRPDGIEVVLTLSDNEKEQLKEIFSWIELPGPGDHDD